jgi:hypothetical protein
MGDRQYGIDPRLAEYAEEIKKFTTKDRNCHCNRWWKYFELQEPVMEWIAFKEIMGMLATVINGNFARCFRR